MTGTSNRHRMPQLDTNRRLPLKRRALYALERALYWSGAGRGYTTLKGRGGATIVMYHSVAAAPAAEFIDPACHVTPKVFEAQIAWLKKHRRIISLNRLVDSISLGETPEPGTVAITFDDGYLDNLKVAAPILAKYDVPAILYLATRYIDEGQPQWVDQLYSMFQNRSRNVLEIPGRGVFSLNESAGSLEAYDTACGTLISASYAERNERLIKMQTQLQPDRMPPRLTLVWSEIGLLAEQYPRIELGIHTADHRDLTACSLDETREQIERSQARLLSETGHSARHFSFPYSRATQQTRDLVRDLGYKSATGGGVDFLINADTDCFSLSRLDSKVPDSLLRFWTSGAYPDLPRRLVGRA